MYKLIDLKKTTKNKTKQKEKNSQQNNKEQQEQTTTKIKNKQIQRHWILLCLSIKKREKNLIENQSMFL